MVPITLQLWIVLQATDFLWLRPGGVNDDVCIDGPHRQVDFASPCAGRSANAGEPEIVFHQNQGKLYSPNMSKSK